METLLLKNVRFLVTCDDEDRVLEHANVLIKDGVVDYIGYDEQKADKSIDASRMVFYPGLLNSHHHLYQIFTRNLPQVQNMELFPWLKTLYEIWKNIDGDQIYYSSMTGLGELLKTGCTTVLDHHYVFPQHSADTLLDAQFAAAGEIGVRMYATRGSMDLSVKDGGLPPDTVVQSIDEILCDSQKVVEKFHDGSRYSMRNVALAPCSPFSVTGDLLRESANLARTLGVRLHTHLAETKDEENFTLEKFGMRPLAYMETLGWIGDDVWYAHGIHFNDEELKVLAETGTGVAHCPISNMKLSSGIARIPEMLKMDVPVGLAVDGSASNDGSNILEEIRVAYLLHRLNSSSQAPSGYDILKMATRGNARILGRPDLGQIAVGCAGDCFGISLDKLELVGADFDPTSMLGCVGYKGAVDYTIVNGKVVVEHGHLVNIDEAKVTEKANESCKRLYR